MSEHTDLIERAAARYEPPDLAMDGLLKRRDRKRRNQRITAAVVGIAVFVSAIWIVTSGAWFDRTQTPAGPGPAESNCVVTRCTETGPPVVETGPAVTGGENPEPSPLIVPAPIGTVTQSGAGCRLEIVAEPIPPGAGRFSVVNETNRWVSFELFSFDPEVLSFEQFEAIIASGDYGGPHPKNPPGAFVLVKREVGPGASGTITDNFTTGAFAVVCLDQHQLLETDYDFAPFALVGPIVVT